jgi:hypothetical protein
MGKIFDGFVGTMGVAILTGFAFSRKTREAIRMRAGERCEVTGRSDWPLEDMHLDHNRHSPDYDKKETGLRVILPVHAAHHESFRGRAHEIGLTESNNNFAVRSILARIWDFAFNRGMKVEEVFNALNEAHEKIDGDPNNWFCNQLLRQLLLMQDN